MQKFLFFILIALALPVAAQESEWKTIYPVASCTNIPINYKEDVEGGYTVKLNKSENMTNISDQMHIENINDLSILTDYIIEQSEKYCPFNTLSFEPLDIDTDNISCSNGEFFSDDYMQFVKFTADYVIEEGNQCENIIPFIKLQEEISQLDKQDLITFKKTKKFSHLILKIFANKEDDKLMDQFAACGGKKGSDKFLRNMILLEAQASCIIPGMLSWEDAEEIADKISGQYKNKGILKIVGIKDQLTREATLAFTDKIMHNEINSMMGSTFEANKKEIDEANQLKIPLTRRQKKLKTNSTQVISELNSKKRLEKFDNNKKVTDYVAYVFSVDAAVEVGKSAIPIFLDSTFYSKLPSTWTDTEKEDFINDSIIGLAESNYDKCMADRIEFSQYGKDIKIEEITEPKKKKGPVKTVAQKKEEAILKHRLETKDKFCSVNKDQCEEDNCEGSVNMLQMDDSATDTEIVQGCVLQSISIAIEPLLESIIDDKIQSFNIDEKVGEPFAQETWNTLKNCANEEIKKKQNLQNDIDITTDQLPLQKIKTADYESVLLTCADKAEAHVARKFVNQVLINEESLQKAFGDPKVVSQWNEAKSNYEIRLKNAKSENEKKIINDEWEKQNESFKKLLNKDKDVLAHSEEIINNSYDLCLNKQMELSKLGHTKIAPKHGLEKKNPLLCTPIVEMNASLSIVGLSLEDLMTTEDLNENEEAKKVLADFNLCKEGAINEAVSDIGSLTSNTPINTDIQAESYLDNNPTMFKCVEAGISQMSYVVAGKSIDQQIEEQKGKIKDVKYFASLKSNTQQIVKECFSNGIKEQKNWSGFTSFNESDGMEKLQKECEMEATKYVVSNLVMNEAKIEMLPLIDDGFLKDKGDIYDIRSLVAVELRKDYKIPKKEGVELVNYSYAEALEIHMNNGGTQDSFVDEISKTLEKHAIKRVHKNLNSNILTKTTNPKLKKELTDFSSYFPSSCLQTIYNRFIKNAPKTDGEPMTLDKLSGYLQTGLSFAYNKSPKNFDSELNKLKSQCKNMSQFKTEKDFHKSQFYSIIVKGQIYEKFKTDFKSGIMDSLDTQEKELTDPHKWIKQRHMTDMKKRMNSLLDESLTEEAFNKLIFNNSDVMDFATGNLDGLLTDDPAVKKKLSRLLVGKMYEKSGDDSFADKFAQIQVEGNFGIEGVTEAHAEAGKGKSILWGLMSVGQKSGKKAALGYFKNVDNIKNVIDWKNLDEGTRKVMATSIFYDGVAENLIDRSEPIDAGLVYGAVSRNDRFVDRSTLGVGYAKYRAKIEKMTDDVTNGYKNYENNIEYKAKMYAKDILKSYPAGKKSMTEKQLADHIAKDIKAEHMERNVTNMLLKAKDSNGDTVEDKIKADIEDKASDIFWGNTAEAQAAQQKRAMEKATNPWPVGPKW